MWRVKLKLLMPETDPQIIAVAHPGNFAEPVFLQV
jgi:hypothetical protein